MVHLHRRRTRTAGDLASDATRFGSAVSAIFIRGGVACLAGTAFGKFGEGFLRFSIANSMENLDEALNRIGAWAKKNL